MDLINKSSIRFFVFILILVSLDTVLAQNSISGDVGSSSWGIITELQNYFLFSQVKSSLKMKAGYPVIMSRFPAVGMVYHNRRSKLFQELKISVSLPSDLSSDNGTGVNYLLQKESSTCFSSQIDYRLSFMLFRIKKLTARHGLVSGFHYENYRLHYLSGSYEKIRETGFYIGPGLQFVYHLSEIWMIETAFDGRFYIPYLSYGTLVSVDDQGVEIFSSGYRPFYYQSVFRAGVDYKIYDKGVIKAGIMRSDLLGFGCRKPLFNADSAVHYKIGRLLKVYIEYDFLLTRKIL